MRYFHILVLLDVSRTLLDRNLHYNICISQWLVVLLENCFRKSIMEKNDLTAIDGISKIIRMLRSIVHVVTI